MLAMFNESKTNWIRATINNRTSKITTSRTLNDGKVRYLDVLISGDIETPDITNVKDMTDKNVCTTLYEGNTTVKFKSKDLKPFINKSDKYNNDVLFININLKGKIIKSTSNDNSILAYLIAQGELFLIVSLNDKNNNMKFEIVLHDPHAVADTTYTFEKVNGTYNVTTEMAQTDNVITNPVYKINRYRPARPTNLIFVNDSDENHMLEVLKYPDSHKIMICMDGDVDDLIAYIDPLKDSGYKAATLYVNTDNFIGGEDKDYGAQFNALKNNFKFVNVLLNNGKVIRK